MNFGFGHIAAPRMPDPIGCNQAEKPRSQFAATSSHVDYRQVRVIATWLRVAGET